MADSKIITSNLESVFKESKDYWKNMKESSSLVDMSRTQLQKMVKHAAMKPQITRQNPTFYHPLFEKINLQLPTKTREINQWCVIGATNITMGDLTERRIKDIGIGDEVLTHTGRIQQVAEVFVHSPKNEKLYTIKSRGVAEPLTLTSHHKLLVIRREEVKCLHHDKQRCRPQQLESYCKSKKCERTNLKAEWTESKDLCVGDCLLTPIYSRVDKDFELSIDKARLFGYYCSEGNISHSGSQFTFHKKETDYISEVRATAMAMGINTSTRENTSQTSLFGNAVTVSLFSRKLAREFIQHIGRGSHNKKFSKMVMSLPIEVQKNILGTIINGDGSQSATSPIEGTVRIATVSDSLATQLVYMFARCGVVARKYTEDNNRGITAGRKGFKINFVAIRPQDANKFLEVSDLNFTEVRHPRQECFIYENYIVRPIDSIEVKKCTEKVYNLAVVDDNSYVANGVAVHNCRHFYKTDGFVGNLIDLHSEFPLTSCHLVCDDTKIKKFFEILFFDVLRGEKLLLDINQEYWKLGNAFPFGEWDDDKGIWTRFVMLNPDFVEVEKSMLVDEPQLKLDPDDNLKRIVQSRQPRELYNQLARIQGGKIVNLIARGEKIPLNQFRVSHLAYKLSPYETVGTPIMFRAFKALIYKDILRRAQMAIAERHITPIKVVKVGTDQIPATPDAIQAAKEAFDELNYDLSSWFFSHHAISFDYVSSAGKVLPLNTEYEWVDKEITAALLGSKTIIDGSGPNFATASVALRILVNRYLRNQEVLKDWVKNYVFKPIAIQQKFTRVNEWGEEEYIIPDIEFEFMNLKDDAQMKTLMKELMTKGLLSRQTYYNYLGINWEKEKKIIDKEREQDKKDKVTPEVKKEKPALEAPGMDLGSDLGMGGGGEGLGGGMEAPGKTEMPGAPAGAEGGMGGGPGAEGIA